MLPADAVPDRAGAHHQLGNVYSRAGNYDTALTHYQQAIRHFEDVGDRYHAGTTRYNTALTLEAGRPEDALLYARAALRDLERYGANATTEIALTRQLIARIEATAHRVRS
jgi:tetratricopeptide (TPR) repeat protein